MIKSGHLQSNIKPGSLVRFKLDSDIGHIYQDKVGIVIRKFDPEDAMTCPEGRLVYVYDILVNGTIRAFAPHEIELINKTTMKIRS